MHAASRSGARRSTCSSARWPRPWRPAPSCVVLSGTGADGSMGLKRVKERGGICLVQDPGEAEHDDMPRNAIATGAGRRRPAGRGDAGAAHRLPRPHADMCSSPERAGARAGAGRAGAARDLHAAAHAHRPRLLQLQARHGAAADRAAHRRARQLPDLAAYARVPARAPRGGAGAAEGPADQRHQLLPRRCGVRGARAEVIPRLFEGKSEDDQVRVWVAGCATGEEAYSLGDAAGGARVAACPAAPSIQIFATDIDEQADRARARGRLHAQRRGRRVAGAAAAVLHQEGERYRVRKELREMVLFAHHNLIKDPPFSHLDLVSCRNLLIYLNRTAQQRVMEVLHFALNAGRLPVPRLVRVGRGLHRPVRRRRQGRAHLSEPRRWPRGSACRCAADLLPVACARLHAVAPRRDPRARAGCRMPDLHQRLLEHYAPPSIVVNEDTTSCISRRAPAGTCSSPAASRRTTC